MLLIYPPPPTHLDITLKMHSRTIKSQHHAQDFPWSSAMLSYREFCNGYSQVHNVETRLRTLSVSLSSSFKFNGTTLWNKLPLKIKKLNSLTSFKQVVRRHLKESSKRIQLRLSMLLVCLSCI